MLMNLTVECLHKLFEILLHGRFLFILGLFVSFSKIFFIYLRERGNKNHDRERAEVEGEAGFLQNRERALGPGS